VLYLTLIFDYIIDGWVVVV